jgi:hypothetical protein
MQSLLGGVFVVSSSRVFMNWKEQRDDEHGRNSKLE